ncbi:hypothetical protein C8R44DRAFT_749674 [Mycena epipterygia]|nr:hypothetical protein C8R44DRAFT_749674 [Mycena epipterygia]
MDEVEVSEGWVGNGYGSGLGSGVSQVKTGGLSNMQQAISVVSDRNDVWETYGLCAAWDEDRVATDQCLHQLPRPPASELEMIIDDLPANPRQAEDAGENQELHRRQLVMNRKALLDALQESRKGCLQGLSVPGALEHRFTFNRVWKSMIRRRVVCPPLLRLSAKLHWKIATGGATACCSAVHQEGVDPRTCQETEKSVERAWTNTRGKQYDNTAPFPPTRPARKHNSRRRSRGNFTIVKLGGMRRCGSGEYEAHSKESAGASASASRVRTRFPMVSARQRMGGGARRKDTWRGAESGGGGTLYVSTPKHGNEDVKEFYKA